ncbi:XRE family transcriptional regulator [Streptomyces spectabilis]|uniref:XRE family transcriptional regulator n=1 Tax=Streptomyces spectabilis TaxID=68270 RepID=UPI0033F9A31E
MADEAAPRTDLADLVRRRAQELGLSYRTLVEAAVDPENPDEGPQWSKGTLENLVNKRAIKAPTERQLRAMAAGLQLPLLVVQRAAAAQYFGMVAEHWDGTHEARVLISRIHELDERELQQLDELAQIVLRRRER